MLEKKCWSTSKIRSIKCTISGQEITGAAYWVHDGCEITYPETGTEKRVIVRHKGRNKLSYIPLYMGFDIETTNYIHDNYKVAYMYIWQYALATDQEICVYLGRTWDDFVYLLDSIITHYGLCKSVRAICWDANMGFEYQFLRKHLQWTTDDYSFFAKEERKPLLCTYREGLEMREALTISGGSLAQLAKDYCTTQKLVGDLDYSIERNDLTPLTDTELSYCINDVVILAEFSANIFERFIRPDKKVPLTKTGILRSETKREFNTLVKNKNEYMQTILQAYPDERTYKLWFRWLFRGGFVHANYSLANQILTDMRAFDITSSYPARMNLSYYPVTPFRKCRYDAALLQTHCCIMIVDLYDVRSSTMHSIESGYKIIDSINPKYDNGRLYQADYIRVWLTELDWDNYQYYYKWSRFTIKYFATAKRGKLPIYLRSVLNRHYITKAELKAAGKSDTPEYAIVKSGVNSAYGLTVTRLCLDKVSCDGETWSTDPVALEYEKEKQKQILLPQWGIYVAAHARHELLQMVKTITEKCGNIIAYCDTDSIKCKDHPLLDGIIADYNKDIAAQLKAAGLTHPAFHDLGMFDDEYKGQRITRFKTLGAKRYLTEVNGKVKATIAGLPKDVLLKYKEDPFDAFKADGMEIAADISNKLTTRYNDEEHSDIIAGRRMHELSSVCLYSIPFTMLTENTYYEMIVHSAINDREKLGG